MTKNNTTNTGFADAFYSLPANKLIDVRLEICEEMGWHYTTFISKRAGRRKLKKPERAVLQDIFRRHGIEFNGE